jgi:DNA polymerase-3 subunit epsilon
MFATVADVTDTATRPPAVAGHSRPAPTGVPAPDPSTPLHDVTFCVVDLETTGGSPADSAITEVGAARFRGGECLATFQTLVNPGVPIPPEITVLTGITEAMVLPAPPPSSVLPSLLEFVGSSVLVGHNLRFDVSFLDAALTATERDGLTLPSVDTVALARRLVRDEDVLDCRLATLAERFALPHRPTHRALDDVLATADLLHLLLERAAGLGVTELDDLLALPRLAGHPHAGKLRLTTRLPRAPGVYLLRDGQGRVTHVGRAANLRRQVRAAFSRERGRIPGPLLRTVHRVDHRVCSSGLHAAVLRDRLARAFLPREAARSRRYHYVKLLSGRVARLVVARTPGTDSSRALGPLPSAGTARTVAEVVAEMVPEALGPDAVIGAEATSVSALAERALRLLWEQSDGDRAASLAAAVGRQRRFDQLVRAERVAVTLPDGAGVEIRRGRLVGASFATAGAPAGGSLGDASVHERLGAVALPPVDAPMPREMAAEVDRVGRWLERNAHRLRLVAVEGELSSRWPGVEATSRTRAPVPRWSAPDEPRAEAPGATVPASVVTRRPPSMSRPRERSVPPDDRHGRPAALPPSRAAGPSRGPGGPADRAGRQAMSTVTIRRLPPVAAGPLRRRHGQPIPAEQVQAGSRARSGAPERAPPGGPSPAPPAGLQTAVAGLRCSACSPPSC